MVNKCVAPGCTSGYTSAGKNDCAMFRFPKNEQLNKIWIARVPRHSWKPSKNAVLCERHFVSDDFLPERVDTNVSRKKKRGNLERKKLKQSAIPSQWPNCPEHLSTVPAKKRSSKVTADSRRSEEERAEKEREASDRFSSLEELSSKFCLEDLPYSIHIDESCLVFSTVSVSDSKPVVNFS